MDDTMYLVIAIILVIAIVLGYLVFKWWQGKQKGKVIPTDVLPPGWQFYQNLTTGDPPGTIYEITKEKHRQTYSYPESIEKIHRSKEAQGRIKSKIQAKLGDFVNFLGLNVNLALNANHVQDLTLVMDDTEKETLVEKDVVELIDKSFKDMKPDPSSRYIIIREARSTKEIDYMFTKNQVDNLGGKVEIEKAVTSANANLEFSKTADTEFKLQRKFDQPMRVMFLAEEIQFPEEEIRFRGAGTDKTIPGVKQFSRKPLKEPIDWTGIKQD